MDRIGAELIRQLPIGIIIYKIRNINTIVLEKANDAAHSVMQGQLQEIIGKALKDIPGYPPEIIDSIRSAYLTKQIVNLDAFQIEGLSGWFHVRIFRLSDSGYVIETIEDISDMRSVELAAQAQLAQLVEDKTKDLEHSNQALQSFVYAASHDLREPLSKIMAFGNRLETTQKNLDDKGQEYLKVMLNATSRLTRLIDDLLSFSRMGEKDQDAPGWVNTSTILQEVITDLSVSIETTQAVLDIQPELPMVLAHPMRIRQLFQNLISNALKFHKPNQVPVIHISGKRDGNMTVFTVRDEGIGFDPQYKDKIFNVFTRLYSRFDYPGTGLGLALCRRIVTLYGGSITAEGNIDAGATFTFSLSTPVEQLEL